MKTDLHIHTYYSDGVFSPEKIVDTAMDVGLEVIALTDHDNVLSYKVATDYLKKEGKEDKLKIIQGVEINTLYKNYEIHILGYFMDTSNSDFQNLLKVEIPKSSYSKYNTIICETCQAIFVQKFQKPKKKLP